MSSKFMRSSPEYDETIGKGDPVSNIKAHAQGGDDYTGTMGPELGLAFGILKH